MSDLIERLRDGVQREASGKSALWDSIMAEAADEIERLHELHLDRTKLTTRMIEERDHYRDKYMEGQARIEQLEERHRLTSRHSFDKQVKLQKRIERLEGALREIASEEKRFTNHGYKIAKQALGGDDNDK